MVFVAEALGGWLIGQMANAGRKRLGSWLLGSELERALQQAATAAIQATARQWRPGPATTDDPQSADHLARVIDQVFQQAPTPADSLVEYPTLLQGLQAGVAARLAVLEDVHITGTTRSSAAALGISVPALAETLNGQLLRELLTRGAGGGPLTPLASQLNHELTRQTFAEQGRDRYTMAIEQLGSDKLDVRLGGIYNLEFAARDPARDHPTVMEVLAAFVREHSHKQWPLTESGTHVPGPEPRPDVQAALTVIGRRDNSRDREPINLAGADLVRADLTDALLTDALLTRALLDDATLSDAYLTRAYLRGATLRGAHLDGAHLDGADLMGADLNGAILYRADLMSARLRDADLTGAILARAILTDAILVGADLTGAHLDGAILTGANLVRAHLNGAYLDGAILDAEALNGANLTNARWPRDAPVPRGWKLDTGSGRLEADRW
jgi:hypothetical protein